MNNKKIGFIFPAFAMKFTGKPALYQNEVDELSSLASRHVAIDSKRFEEMTEGVIEDELQAHYFCYINSGAVSTVMKKQNIVPEYLAGYSMGLFSALFHAEAVSFEEGLLLMHNTYNTALSCIDKKRYGMGVIVGLTYDTIDNLINDNSIDIEIIDISNEHVINVTGLYDDVVGFLEIAGKTALNTKMLPITLPYHSKFTNNASDKIREVLSDLNIKQPEYKIVSCVNQKVLSSARDIKDELLINVSHSINWSKTMQKMLELEVNLFIECGMSKSLTQLAKFIDGNYKIYNTSNLSKMFVSNN
jgi:[acyl-carrier-protein] S-malonyltransferase